jgi:nitrogen fixation NifU-like protein
MDMKKTKQTTYGYSRKVMDVFTHPANMGEIKDADGVGKVGNPQCGDLMWLYIRVKKNRKGEEYLDDIKVKTFGCIAAISTSSILTEMAKGMTLEKALKIDKMEIVRKLGGLPPIKVHCSVLSSDALKEAIYDYYRKNGRMISKELQEQHERNERIREGIEHMH